MKIILGDNQFFGINHNDIEKGLQTKNLFGDSIVVEKFIIEALELGLDGFMINSNNIGYQIVKNFKLPSNKEIHYSIPYPHKFATLVNEEGMLSLLHYFVRNTSLLRLMTNLPKFLLTGNLAFLLPFVTSLEVPKSLPKGSYVYMQNIVTDLILGLNRYDIFESFARSVRSKGYKPGLITLNPKLMNSVIMSSNTLNSSDVIMCFNINNVGFNVFPNNEDVEAIFDIERAYMTMGMSIFASGGSNVADSINYIKELPLDYVVFGSSRMENIKANFLSLKRLD